MTSRNSAFIRLVVTTALASTALSGCGGKVAPSAAHSVGKAEVALEKGKGDKAVQHAEAAVLAAPRDAYSRTLLGNAYLEAGRFASASQSFKDAIELGDTSPRTAVSLSLALTGMGDRAAAIYTLEKHEAAIDPADYGLAIALAGQPQRGVHVLSNALRAGNNTAKVRQNLAYAYAMSGQWREARLMAAEDVPADKVGDRMAEWGAIARPEQYRTRIASLLNVEIVSDTGRPEMLALSNHPSVDMLAAETIESTPQASAAEFASNGELPPVNGHAPIERVAVDDAFLDAMNEAPRATVTAAAPQQIIAPVAETKTPSASVVAPARRKTMTVAQPTSSPRKSRASEPTLSLANGDYNIQLGSYFSMADAEHGWEKFQTMYPELSAAERVISRARVNGKLYFRVAAVGYAKDSAQALCSNVKGKGGACIAYANSNPLPGALDNDKVRVAAR